MQKIPTVFVRDENDRRFVTPKVTPGCEWVLAGEGTPTRKFDGTCVLIRRDGTAVHAFARREVKPGKEPPPEFVAVATDETTGKTVGWEPAAQSGFAKYIEEALGTVPEIGPGTYELCGPKVNGNPEGYEAHVLVEHGLIEATFAPRTFESLRDYLALHTFEGVVWHHPDGRMAKLKRRDFPREAK